MKTKSKHREKETRLERAIQCIDRLDDHRGNIETLAKLLDVCRWADDGALEGKAVADAADMITKELEGMRDEMRRLAEELRR